MNVLELLKVKYPFPDYVVMKEVSDHVGTRQRSADFIAMSMWSSRGLAITGFELKASRSDWLREFKDHSKAENIFQYCDYFYLITTDEKIAKIEEIPEDWGWMNIKNGRFYLKKSAPKLKPKSLSKGFVAAMLRRAHDKENYIHIDSIDDKIKSAIEVGKNQELNRSIRIRDDYESLLKTVNEFEKASGVDLSIRWRMGDIGKAVSLLTQNNPEQILKNMSQMMERITNVSKELSDTISVISNLPTLKVAELNTDLDQQDGGFVIIKGKKYYYWNKADLRFTGWEDECIIIDRSSSMYLVPAEKYAILDKNNNATQKTQ